MFSGPVCNQCAHLSQRVGFYISIEYEKGPIVSRVSCRSAETKHATLVVMIKVRTGGSRGRDESNRDFCVKCVINKRRAQINADVLE